MTQVYYYVCDHCGLVHHEAAVPEGGEWECADCGSHAAWEFTDKHNAYAHAGHIQRGMASGIFRKVRS